MNVLLFPFFLVLLGLKNAWSWGKISLETFGFPLIFTFLIFLNAFLGYTLYNTFQQQQKLTASLEHAEVLLKHQKQFWGRLAKEVPGHNVIEAAQKTLAE